MASTDRQAYIRFACAIVVFKSKPTSVSTEAYILSLRKSLLCKSRSRPGAGPILDSTVLWHDLFLQTQRDNLDLRVQCAVQHYEDNTSSATPCTPRKRKCPASSTIAKDNRQAKRRKPLEISDLASEEQNISIIEQHRDRALLLRVIYGLARTKDQLPSGDERADSIIHLACDTIIENCKNAQDATTSKTAKQSQPPTLNESCIAAKNIWSILLSKLRSDTSSLEKADDPFAAVYSAICTVVEAFLGRLHQYCLDEADRRMKLAKRNTKVRGRKTKAPLQNDSMKAELFKHNSGLIASALAHMLDIATTLQQRHQKLFEAIASIFLEHLGSAMSLHLFGDPDSSDDGRVLAPPRGVEDVFHIETKDALLTTQLEAPYLVSMLKGLMRSEVSRDDTSKPNNRPKDIQNNKINSVILHKLQSRLIRGIFGDDIEVSAASGATGARPPSVDSAESCEGPAQNTADEDWFLSQVWGIIGWDILLNRSDGLELAAGLDA